MSINSRGLEQDKAPINQSKDTTRFVLNGVNESLDGDLMNLSCENSNLLYTHIKEDFIILGSLYIGDGETIIFSVKDDNSESEIGILKDNTSYKQKEDESNYEVWCNDSCQNDTKKKLNFRVNKPVDATYRIRRGCEKNVYFTDFHNVPRKINLQKPEYYQDIIKNDNGEITSACWNANKFKLINTYNKIPKIDTIEVLDGGGNLKSGSYSYMVQYLDEDFNPSPTILEVNDIHIYRDSLNTVYSEINGSISLDNSKDLYNITPTNKSIRLKFSDLDTKYTFYRVICIEYTSGTGVFTKAFASHPINIEIDVFTHTTNDYSGMKEMTKEELIFSDNATNIEKAEHITQIDNTLLLGNIQGQQSNLCSLQKYASQITVDCFIKNSILTNIKDKHNAKNPTLAYNGLSFQPGEIYSLGIMYLFDDLTVSPVYHIPGKAPGADIANRVYSPEEEVTFPMKNEPDKESSGINANTNITYTDRSDCNELGYWGKDFEGNILDGSTKVRHHRFPTRNELELDFVRETKFGAVAVDSDSNNKVFNLVTKIDATRVQANIKEGDLPYTESKLYLRSTVTFDDDSEIDSDFISTTSEIVKEVFNVSNKGLKHVKVALHELQGKEDGLYQLTQMKLVYESENTTELNGAFSKENPKGLLSDNIYNSYSYTYYRRVNIHSGSGKDIIYNEEYFFEDEVPKIVKDRTVYLEKITTYLFISNESFSFTRDKNYETDLFGIKLSNVKLPDENEIGKKVIGYYVMKQERTDNEKTILATGIVTPTVPNKNYRNLDWFAPFWEFTDGFKNDTNVLLDETSNEVPIRHYKVSKDCYGLTTLEHIFQQKTHDNFDIIEEQGVYTVVDQQFSGDIITDSTGKKTEGNFSGNTEDDDTMTVRNLVQCTTVEYKKSKVKDRFNIPNVNVDIFDLQPLSFGTHPTKSDLVYNMSLTDRKMAIMYDLPKDEIQRKIHIDKHGLSFFRPDKKDLPYVYLKKNKQEFYTNYRQNPYYKINENYIPFESNKSSEVKLLGGDMYVSPMRLSSHSYQGAVSGFRQEKQSWWNTIIAVLAVIAATIVVAASWATLTPLASIIAASGVGLMAAGSVMLGVAEQMRAEKINDMMSKHWKGKLDDTVFDTAHHVYFRNPIYFLAKGRYNFNKESQRWNMSWIGRDYRLYWDSITEYTDDTVWMRGKVLCDVFFESQINTSLMCETSQNKFNPLKPFKSTLKPDFNFWGKWAAHTKFDTVSANYRRDYIGLDDKDYRDTNEFNNHFYNKTFEINNEGKTKLVNLSTPTLYHINSDYNISHKIKAYFHLPIEYDCCSKCKEEFTHRWFWSNQSFSEELTDNYRVFKPNNYKDLQGETGRITNMFVFQNNLYIHTEEALWLQPRNQQQQIIDQVTTFIGTGEYYSISPQRIIDSTSGYSGGTILKQSVSVTPYGILYVSDKDRKIYLFNGSLQSLSDKGLQKWFNKNIIFEINKDFKVLSKKEYPLMDNPQSKLGAGVISVFDKENERYIFTKKDYGFNKKYNPGTDISLQTNGKEITIFKDVTNTVNNKINEVGEDGKPLKYKFNGFNDNGEMDFERVDTIEEVKEISYKEFVFKDVDYIVLYYDFGRKWRQSVDTEEKILNDHDLKDLDTMTTFRSPEVAGPFGYACGSHGGSNSVDAYPEDKIFSYCGDNTGLGLECVAINMKKFREQSGEKPEIMKWDMRAYWWGSADNINLEEGIHGHVVVYCKVYKKKDNSKIHLNRDKFEFFVTTDGTNSYDNRNTEDGFFTFNPNEITQRHTNGCSENATKLLGNFEYDYEKIILKDTDGNIINNYKDQKVTVTKTIKTTRERIVHHRIKGEVVPLESFYDNSWTISYSLKNQSWTSWHSYLPNCYIDMEKFFYSWLNGNKGIFKHNIPHKFQEFYGKKHPFIIEFVNNENPLQTTIFEYITFITQALRWDNELESYTEERFITFNKGMFYNSRQNSGILNLIVKDLENTNNNYLLNQVKDYNGDSIILDRNELDWTANEIRDYRNNYNTPLFIENKDTKELQDNYFIDKVVNNKSLDYNKSWDNLEMLRDKYLVVRLIFDNFEDIKLIFNFSTETKLPTLR